MPSGAAVIAWVGPPGIACDLGCATPGTNVTATNGTTIAAPRHASPRNLTSDSGDTDTSMGWTPDGHVLFLSNRSHTGGTFLYFMDADGANIRLVVRL